MENTIPCKPVEVCKPKKQVFNADFALIAITVATLHSYLMVYTVIFLS